MLRPALFISGLLAAVAVGPEVGAQKEQGVVRFVAEGLEHPRGTVRCALFDGEDTWLEEAAGADEVPIRDGRAVCTFREVSAGVYAVGAYHDEDGDGELDRKVFGIPTEGVIFSRNAKGRMGPPKFDDAKFRFDGGRLTLRARARY
ncbi:MAG: DUF2141 domain-containing protein [Myxococcota bacterium]